MIKIEITTFSKKISPFIINYVTVINYLLKKTKKMKSRK